MNQSDGAKLTEEVTKLIKEAFFAGANTVKTAHFPENWSDTLSERAFNQWITWKVKHLD